MGTSISDRTTIRMTTWRALVDAAAAWGFDDLGAFADWVSDQSAARCESLPEPPSAAERAQMDEIDLKATR